MYSKNFGELSNGERICYRETNRKGNVIIMIHDILSNSLDMGKTMRQLELHDYHCFAVDLRGCGYSTN